MKSRPPLLAPNRLSFLRILIGLLLPVLLLWPTAEGSPQSRKILWGAFILFLFGAFTDFWDGWMARRHRLETPLGRILDPTADKIFILGAMTSFAVKGLYSYWYLVPIFFREGAVTFSRIAWMRQGKAIGAERGGKIKLGLQVTSVLFSFVYLAFPLPMTFSLNQFFLIVAVLMTLSSGFFFFLHHRELLKERDFLRAVAALGVGYLRPLPGTYGSLVGLLLVLLVAHDFFLHLLTFFSLLLLAYFVIPRLGLGEKEDPLEIVLDEVCGILLAFLGIPLNLGTLVGGFLLFRFFDVTKVFPLGWLEKRRGVHGIILDDLGAGIYTWLILKIGFK